MAAFDSVKHALWLLCLDPIAFVVDRLFRRPYRPKLLPLAELNSPEAGAGYWESTGNDPQFVVSGSLPKGWLKFTLNLQSDALRPDAARLYFDRGHGYSEGDSLELPANGKDVARWIFAGDLKHLRFDPSMHPGRFRIRTFQFQRSLALHVKISRWIGQRRPRQTRPAFRDPDESLPTPYETWLEVNQWSPRRTEFLQARLEALTSRPVISVVIPVYNPPLKFLIKAVETVRNQVYSDWELCLADDCSTDVRVQEYLRRLSLQDSRIKVYFRSENGNISRATNDAVTLASGEFVAFLDQDDELTPDALGEVAIYLDQNPETDYLYSDDDKIDADGRRFDPQFKPDWSPELLLSYMYMSHLVVVRRDLFGSVGGLRVGFEGSQDYDLAFRMTEKARHVAHLPLVLYHWRVLPGSTALSGSEKPASFQAGQRAVQEALNRRAIAADVVHPEWAAAVGCGIFSHHFPDDGPRIAILIRAQNGFDRINACVASLQKTTYRNFDVIVLHDAMDDTDVQRLAERFHPAIRFHRTGRPLNPAAVVNAAVTQIGAEYILFLNDATEVISPAWLSQMAGYLSIEGVGAVGARLLSPGGNVEHAGIVHGYVGGIGVSPWQRLGPLELGYLSYTQVARNYSACSGACLLVRRDLFVRMDGFDATQLGASLHDLDLCYRFNDQDARVVYCPTAELYLHEDAASHTVNEPGAEAVFKNRYRSRRDRYYNPNLSLDDPYFALAARAPLRHAVPSPIKTLMVSHNLGLEGAPNSQLEITSGLLAAGVIDPIVISPLDGPLRSAYEQLGIQIQIRPLTNDPVNDLFSYQHSVAEWRDWIQSTKVELVYGNTRLAFPIIHAAKLANVPSIWNLRESEPLETYFDGYGGLVASEALRCFRYPYQNVYVARSTMESCRGFDTHHNFCTIHNGLDRQRFAAELEKHDRLSVRQRLGVRPDDIAVLLLGTVCERKGQIDLVDAAARLPDDVLARTKFLIVGDRPGPYSDEMRSRLTALAAGRSLHFSVVAETADAAAYYSAADIFVCSSRIESFPRVILEAMAAGLPIVTTPVFGIAEQVRPEVNALFYSPGASADLAHHLERLVNDRPLMMRLGRHSLEVLDTLTDYDSMLDDYATVFREAWVSGRSR